MSRPTHDRTDLHFGLDQDLIVTLSQQIGELQPGTDLHATLVYLNNWISDRESGIAAAPTFQLNAITRRVRSLAFTTDAAIVLGQLSFTLDAVIGSGSGLTALKLRSFDGSMNSANVLPDAPMIRIYKKDRYGL